MQDRMHDEESARDITGQLTCSCVQACHVRERQCEYRNVGDDEYGLADLLAKPATRGPRPARTAPTASFTAAWAGTRSRRRIW